MTIADAGAQAIAAQGGNNGCAAAVIDSKVGIFVGQGGPQLDPSRAKIKSRFID